ESAPKEEAAKKLRIAVIPKLLGIPYFNGTGEGAMKAGEELGVEVIYTGPTKVDAAEQVKMIEDMISRGVDAICVAPNDPAAMSGVLKKAREAGILILDWDTPADINLVDYSIHQIDDDEYAKAIWDQLVIKAGKEEMNYAIITGGLSAAGLNNWIRIGTEYAKVKYPKLNLVTDIIPADEKQQVAYTKTLDLLKAYPELDGIVGLASVTPVGCAQAIREKGLNDKITLVGTIVEEDTPEYLADGSLDAGLLWSTQKLGYLTVAVATAALKGEKIENGAEIPGFGKIQVKEYGKTVIMGSPAIYEKK
ncbi:MAG: autoinducer 2 ABC transporter substrate-binding protein, partial [Niameybacter sp.]